MSDDTQRWREITRAYAEGALTVAQICNRFSVSKGALYDRARIEGWPPRRDRGRTRTAKPKTAGPDWDQVAHRLYGALERKISELEQVMADRQEPFDASNRERDARTLNGLVRTFEKLREMDQHRFGPGEPGADANKSGGPSSGPSAAADEHADLRAELAARIARLKQLAD